MTHAEQGTVSEQAARLVADRYSHFTLFQAVESGMTAYGELELRELTPISRPFAAADLEAGDWLGWLIWAGAARFRALRDNVAAFKRRGIFEVTLFRSYLHDSSSCPTDLLLDLFGLADRDRLRAAGHPLPPGPWPRTVYRGVAGLGPRRRERGLSWTDRLPHARLYAYAAARLGRPSDLADPDILTTEIAEQDVLVFDSWAPRYPGSGEFIILPPTVVSYCSEKLRGKQRIIHMARWAAEQFTSSTPYALISITDPGAALPNFRWPPPPELRGLLRLQFHDVNMEPDLFASASPPGVTPSLVLPNEDHARSIASFAHRYLVEEPVDLLVIHCEWGLSRSAGVAAALATCIGLPDRDYYETATPNDRVRRLVIAAWEERYGALELTS